MPTRDPIVRFRAPIPLVEALDSAAGDSGQKLSALARELLTNGLRERGYWPPTKDGAPLAPPLDVPHRVAPVVVHEEARSTRGACSMCSKDLALRDDGTVRGHRDGLSKCPGSLQEPA